MTIEATIPPEPGALIMKHLNANQMTLKELSEDLRISTQRLLRVVNNELRIHPILAIHLAKRFKTTSQVWLQISDDYHNYVNQKREELC